MLSPIHPFAEGPRTLRPHAFRPRTTRPRTRHPRAPWSPLLLLAGALVAGGCAVATANRRGGEAERRQDYDRAVVEYPKPVRLHPDDTEARLGLERARLRAAADHFQRGRRLAATGKL